MHVSFDSSLKTESKEYIECIKANNPKYLRSMPNDCSPKEFISFLKNIYSKNNLAKLTPRKNKTIPKIIHQLWLGKRPLPDEYKNFQETWKIKHPTWKYILWTEKLLLSEFQNGLFNQDSFNKAQQDNNFAKMSDIARYEVLYKFGGLYTDCDCECFKPFDILNQTYDFYAGLEHLCNGLVVGNAIMSAKPKHPIIKQCMVNIKEYDHKKIDFKYWTGYTGYTGKFEEEFATTLITTGPILLTKSIWETADKNENKDIIFPPTYFFPFAEYMDFLIKPETFSCHYFKGIWKKDLQRKYEYINF